MGTGLPKKPVVKKGSRPRGPVPQDNVKPYLPWLQERKSDEEQREYLASRMPRYSGEGPGKAAIKSIQNLREAQKKKETVGPFLTGAPDWIKNIPRVPVPELQHTGKLASRPTDMNQPWRNLFGLPQGVTFNTGAILTEEPGWRSQFYKPVLGEQRPEFPGMPTRSRLGLIKARMVREAQAEYDRRYPFGNIAGMYPPEALGYRDFLSDYPPVTASGVIGPNTLQTGMPPFQGAPIPESVPVDWRDRWAKEFELPPVQGPPAPLPNETEVEMPQFVGGPGPDEGYPDYGDYGYGGGGGWSAYTPTPNRWFNQLYNWRI